MTPDPKLIAAMLRIYAGQQRECGRETYAAEIEAQAAALEAQQPVRDFDQWYVENAFDYETAPLGSRDCGLQRKAWNAALTAALAQTGMVIAYWDGVKVTSDQDARKAFRYTKTDMHSIPMIAAAPPASSGWQPIETAPRDGTLVDLWLMGYGRYVNCAWRTVDGDDEPGWSGLTNDGWVTLMKPFLFRPSHWRRLPSHPVGERA